MPQTKAALRPILMADDDLDDCLLTRRALEKNNVVNPFVTVGDGDELMDYLKRKGKYADPEPSPRPCFILLDLNMPKMDGRKALLFVKSDPELKKIPVVVLSTSSAEEDILRSYNLGANSFITKPVNFDDLVSMMESLKNYWLEMVKLPPGNGNESK